MARPDTWFNNNDFVTTSPTWWPLVIPFQLVPAENTLMRTRLDVTIQGYAGASGLTDAYPAPYDGSQVVVAVGWSLAEPPAGYFEEVFFDWIFVQQVVFDFNTFEFQGEPDTFGCYYTNTVESRQADSKSARKTAPGVDGQLYLVIDVNNDIGADLSGFVPNVSWISRVLVKGPAT
jgi:hypothetical protein